MASLPPKLGALRGATLTCPSLAAALPIYQAGLGCQVIDRGPVPAGVAASWGAPLLQGAAFAILAPHGEPDTTIRLVEDPAHQHPVPYATLGWTALEFSVRDCDQAVARLEQAGFTVVGPPQDLGFSDGALRAGQVSGPFGEILYLTQVNAQLEGYTLPMTQSAVGPLFIAILAATSIDAACQLYAERFATIAKDPFEAAVPFIAKFQKLPAETLYRFGCVEFQPGSYVEVDRMADCTPRPCRPGALPGGIAMISCAAASLEPFRAAARGPALADRLTIDGPFGELIEIVQTG